MMVTWRAVMGALRSVRLKLHWGGAAKAARRAPVHDALSVEMAFDREASNAMMRTVRLAMDVLLPVKWNLIIFAQV